MLASKETLRATYPSGDHNSYSNRFPIIDDDNGDGNNISNNNKHMHGRKSLIIFGQIF